jgi:hypothetical protein
MILGMLKLIAQVGIYYFSTYKVYIQIYNV